MGMATTVANIKIPEKTWERGVRDLRSEEESCIMVSESGWLWRRMGDTPRNTLDRTGVRWIKSFSVSTNTRSTRRGG